MSNPNIWLEDCEKPDLKTPVWELDPIARENVMRRRENYEELLFEPIIAERMELPLKWIVQGWLPAGTLAVLAGDPKAGKTCLATALALAVATGTPFGGMDTSQGGVLWLAGEESRNERYQLLKDSPLADIATPLFTCYQHVPIDTAEGLALIQTWTEKVQANLLVVDPLYMATSGRSMAGAAAARRSLMPLKQHCSATGLSALVLHHSKLPRPGEEDMRVAESAQLAASVSMECVLTWRPAIRDPGQKPARVVTMNCRGRGSFANQRLRFMSDAPLHFGRMGEATESTEPLRLSWREEKVLELLREGPCTTEVMCERLMMHPGTLRNAVTSLRRKSIIRIVRVEDKERFWALTNAD